MIRPSDEELERADTWDYERAEVKQPVRNPRAVVSVPFSRDDFARVSAHAQRVGKRTSQFIREAALEKVAGTKAHAVAYVVDISGILWVPGQLPTTSEVSGWQVEQPDEAVATTY